MIDSLRTAGRLLIVTVFDLRLSKSSSLDSTPLELLRVTRRGGRVALAELVEAEDDDEEEDEESTEPRAATAARALLFGTTGGLRGGDRVGEKLGDGVELRSYSSL